MLSMLKGLFVFCCVGDSSFCVDIGPFEDHLVKEREMIVLAGRAVYVFLIICACTCICFVEDGN